MAKESSDISRRAFVATLGASAAAATVGPDLARAVGEGPRMRSIATTGRRLPVIGMGSWITFNVGGNRQLRELRAEVLRTFFDLGGGAIDSSPMYGSSEEVIGWCLSRIEDRSSLFSATKVWTPLKWLGVRQIEESKELWGVEGFDLMQIHNLLNWESHLETLLAGKADGQFSHIGITTSHGRRHRAFETVMAREPVDVVQFTYNIVDREAERRLLPLAAERGLATIINRPFRRGALFDLVAGQPLPEWAAEFDCANWAQFFLKFIVSHPAVTCAIPATSRVDHMRENMGAAYGRLPDAEMRKRMIGHIESL